MHAPHGRRDLAPRAPQPIRPRGTRTLLFLLLLVLGGMWLLARSARDAVLDVTRPLERAEEASRPDPAALERAVLAVESYAARLPEDERAPGRAAERLAGELNASGQHPVRFVVGEPSAPWQVALVPLEDVGAIRVEGYAQELRLPDFMTEVSLTQPRVSR